MADIAVTAGNVVRTSGHVEDVTWGEAITQGQCVYRLSTDGEWYKAQCDDSAAASGYGTGCGIALTAGSNGQPGKVQRNGVINMGATLTVGTIYVVSATAGGVAPSTDLVGTNYCTVLGVARTAALLELNPCAGGAAIPA